MPQKFLVKRSSVEDKVPAAGDLDTGELALNLKDQKLYSKDADGNVFEIGAAQEVDGFVKLDDEGTEQEIVGGGVLNVEGNVTAKNVNTEAVNFLAGGSDHNGVIRFASGPKALYEFNSVVSQEFTLDGNTILSLSPDGDVTAARGVVSQFGTPEAQFGTVAPLNDWSCYPARSDGFRYSQPAPPAPPAPQPEPVDPGFGVDEPTFSGGFVSGGIASGGFVGTQDIIDLEGE